MLSGRKLVSGVSAALLLASVAATSVQAEEVGAFVGDSMSAVYRNISPFYRNISPFYRNISPF